MPEIERWLRVSYGNEEKFEELLHPENNAYGRIFWEPCSEGIQLLESVTEKMKTSSSSFLWLLAWCFVWIAALPLAVAGALIFGLFYYLPFWFYLFGIKYIVLVMRKISYWINQLTPFFIIVFLVYSPVCKQIAVPPPPAP